MSAPASTVPPWPPLHRVRRRIRHRRQSSISSRTDGLETAELWHLLWPALAGFCLLMVGAAVCIGYLRQWLTGYWPPHWSRAALGFVLAVASVPAFAAFAHRVESGAVERGVPILTFVVGVAAQLGLFDDEGRTRCRRR